MSGAGADLSAGQGGRRYSTHRGKWSEIRHDSCTLLAAGMSPAVKSNIPPLAYAIDRADTPGVSANQAI